MSSTGKTSRPPGSAGEAAGPDRERAFQTGQSKAALEINNPAVPKARLPENPASSKAGAQRDIQAQVDGGGSIPLQVNVRLPQLELNLTPEGLPPIQINLNLPPLQVNLTLPGLLSPLPPEAAASTRAAEPAAAPADLTASGKFALGPASGEELAPAAGEGALPAEPGPEPGAPDGAGLADKAKSGFMGLAFGFDQVGAGPAPSFKTAGGPLPTKVLAPPDQVEEKRIGREPGESRPEGPFERPAALEVCPDDEGDSLELDDLTGPEAPEARLEARNDLQTPSAAEAAIDGAPELPHPSGGPDELSPEGPSAPELAGPEGLFARIFSETSPAPAARPQKAKPALAAGPAGLFTQLASEASPPAAGQADEPEAAIESVTAAYDQDRRESPIAETPALPEPLSAKAAGEAALGPPLAKALDHDDGLIVLEDVLTVAPDDSSDTAGELTVELLEEELGEAINPGDGQPSGPAGGWPAEAFKESKAGLFTAGPARAAGPEAPAEIRANPQAAPKPAGLEKSADDFNIDLASFDGAPELEPMPADSGRGSAGQSSETDFGPAAAPPAGTSGSTALALGKGPGQGARKAGAGPALEAPDFSPACTAGLNGLGAPPTPKTGLPPSFKSAAAPAQGQPSPPQTTLGPTSHFSPAEAGGRAAPETNAASPDSFDIDPELVIMEPELEPGPKIQPAPAPAGVLHPARPEGTPPSLKPSQPAGPLPLGQAGPPPLAPPKGVSAADQARQAYQAVMSARPSEPGPAAKMPPLSQPAAVTAAPAAASAPAPPAKTPEPAQDFDFDLDASDLDLDTVSLDL